MRIVHSYAQDVAEMDALEHCFDEYAGTRLAFEFRRQGQWQFGDLEKVMVCERPFLWPLVKWNKRN